MAALKYSRQRESIKHYPCGQQKSIRLLILVYLHVKKQFPNISLGYGIQKPESSDRYGGSGQNLNTKRRR